MKISTRICFLLALSIKCSEAAQRACLAINGPINGAGTIDLTRDVDSSATDLVSGSYSSAHGLPFWTSDARIAALSMTAECTDGSGGLRSASSQCNLAVQLTTCSNKGTCDPNSDETYRSGAFYASATGSTSEYTISGGQGSFNEASGTFEATYDPTDSGYENLSLYMCFIVPEVGDAIHCMGDTDSPDLPATYVYRLTAENKIQHYPSEAVAFSWGKEWHHKTKVIDCTDMTIAEPIAMKPVGLIDGGTYHCIDSSVTDPNYVAGGLYHYIQCELRYLATSDIAVSWDHTFGNAPTPMIDCDGLSLGDPMPLKPEFDDGESISCMNGSDGSGKSNRVYRVVGNKIRRYPDTNIAHSWRHDWHLNIVPIDCTGYPIGALMTSKPNGLEEGDTVKCESNTDLSDNPNKFYRYSDAGLLRYYPSPLIAFSWKALWHVEYEYLDCSGIPHIDDMPLNE